VGFHPMGVSHTVEKRFYEGQNERRAVCTKKDDTDNPSLILKVVLSEWGGETATGMPSSVRFDVGNILNQWRLMAEKGMNAPSNLINT